jgi:DNA mismatch endonuclease (patch repair protein)
MIAPVKISVRTTREPERMSLYRRYQEISRRCPNIAPTLTLLSFTCYNSGQVHYDLLAPDAAMDTVSSVVRSEIMRRVRSENTKPEMLVRRLVHAMGFRYRLHRKSLPGCPDLVFSTRHKVIFVHGCFWHGHRCEAAKLPASNAEYWQAKRNRNVARDRRNLRSLGRIGWRAFVIWECELRDMERTRKRLLKFLGETT